MTSSRPVTVTLTGLPSECPNCHAPAPADGLWVLSTIGHLLHVVCPSCWISVAPVKAVAGDGDAHLATIAEHVQLQDQVARLVEQVTLLARAVAAPQSPAHWSFHGEKGPVQVPFGEEFKTGSEGGEACT